MRPCPTPMLAMLCLWTGACSEPMTPPPPGELIFVRGGLMSPTDRGEGQRLPTGGRLVERAWTPGETVQLDGLSAVAPDLAECLPLFSVDLGDVSRLIAAGGAAPDTSLAFSPDGALLAVGTHRGELLLLDAWTGRVKARRSLSEALVKRVAWSPDGQTLYAAEQSPDAFVHGLDPASLKPRWSLRLADRVGSSPAPGGEDLYGVYSLPAAMGMEVLPDGDLVVAAAHGWLDGDGLHHNRSQLLRVSPQGLVLASWPAEPVSAILQHPAVDASGDRLAVVVTRSAEGADPTGLPIGGVQLLRLSDLSPLQGVVAEPLKPHFTAAQPWEAVDVSAAQNALFTGFADGRVRVVDLAGQPRMEVAAGAPVMAGDVPVVASVGWGRLHGAGAVWSTSYSQIPFGAAAPELRPPTTHPAENTLFFADLAGELRWRWTGPQRIEGLSLGEDGRHLVVGAGDRPTDTRRDLYGALVFDLGPPDQPDDRSGAQRLEAFCPTAGPVFFRQAMSRDGRVAVAEHPVLEPDGRVTGAYQVTVLR